MTVYHASCVPSCAPPSSNSNFPRSFRKSKSSRAPPPPPTEPFQYYEPGAGIAALPPPLHSVIDDPESVEWPPGSRRAAKGERPAVEWADRVAQGTTFDGGGRVRGGAADDANEVRAGYSSSTAQSTAEPVITMRWSAISAQAARVHDCEYIARKLPLHFIVHVVHHSSADPCTQRLLHAVGAYAWHTLASVVQNSLQLHHGLLQVLRPLSPHALYSDAASGAVVPSPAHRPAPAPRRHVGCTWSHTRPLRRQGRVYAFDFNRYVQRK